MGKVKVWTKEDLKELVNLRRSLKTYKEIAVLLDRSEEGIKQRLRKVISSEERRAIVKKLLKQNRICNWDNPEERKKHDHKWYLKNKKKVLERSKRYSKARAIQFQEYKKTQRCSHCDIADFRVLEFHHKKDKKMDISDLVRKASWETVLKELKKCIPLCANCHAILHYEERKNRSVAQQG